MKNASASESSKSQILPSLLPLPASFFKVLPLSQKYSRFHRFRFHISGWLVPESVFFKLVNMLEEK